MPNTGVGTIRVNNVSVNWTDNSSRKQIPCAICRQPTTGRADFAGKNGKVKARAACLGCCIATAMKHGKPANA